MRKMEIMFSWESLAMNLAATCIVVLIGIGILYLQRLSQQMDFTEVRRRKLGLDAVCEYGDLPLRLNAKLLTSLECPYGATPT
jgi:hypothetical protein